MAILHGRALSLIFVVVAACDGSSSGTNPSGDGGTSSGCPLSFAGCNQLDDHTMDTSPLFIAFVEGGGPTTYSSPCILIKRGQSVVLPGGDANPLVNASCSPADSPIPSTPARASTAYTFPNAGNYGYQSSTEGFKGLIVVE